MKYSAFVLTAFLFTACNSNQTLQTQKAADTNVVKGNDESNKLVQSNNNVDTSIQSVDKFAANGQIIPGKSIGNALLNMSADSLEILFGKADVSDAAMGKAWLTWFGKKRDEHNNKTRLDIYTTYKDTSMRERTVQQVRTTSSYFTAKNNVHVYSSLDEIKKAFPGIQKMEQSAENEKIFLLYDDVKNGIAFQISPEPQKICTGIIVHIKGKTARDVYLDVPQQ